jgi:hypothetical protein
MTTTNLNSWRAAAIAIFVGAIVNVAQAQTSPAPLFQNASLTGTGNTITATRVPVVISATITIYVDITLQFNSDSNGNLTLASGFPQIAASASTLTGNFTAGIYVGPATLFNGKGLISVTGPSVSDSGATLWSLAAAAGTDPSLYFTSANWWVGPIANNPYSTRIQKANITSTAYAYGIETSTASAPDPWYSGTNGNLIGVTQTGNVISIATFSTNGGGDQSTPYAIVSFTLQ